MTGEKPIRVFAAGGIRAAIWANTVEKNGREVSVHSVQIDRTFKQGSDFKRTSRFGLADLPRVQLVAAKAFEFTPARQGDQALAVRIRFTYRFVLETEAAPTPEAVKALAEAEPSPDKTLAGPPPKKAPPKVQTKPAGDDVQLVKELRKGR